MNALIRIALGGTLAVAAVLAFLVVVKLVLAAATLALAALLALFIVHLARTIARRFAARVQDGHYPLTTNR